MTFGEELKKMNGQTLIKVCVTDDNTLDVTVSEEASEKMIYSVMLAVVQCAYDSDKARYQKQGLSEEQAKKEAMKSIGTMFLAFHDLNTEGETDGEEEGLLS